MSYNVVLSAEAQVEETEAYNYYEALRPGLGEYLLSELVKSYDKIAAHPFYYGYLSSSHVLRYIKVDTFPYIIIYLVSGNTIAVLSVRNTHRRPFI